MDRTAARRWSCVAWTLTLACTRAPEPPPAAVPPAEPAPAVAPAPAPPSTSRLTGRGEVTIAGRSAGPRFAVEVARTTEERSQGLMHRHALADDAGMLFFMPDDDDWKFWMRNTYLRLDMVFVDRDWRVVGVLEDVPPLNDEPRSVGADSRYVLELGSKIARRHGIGPGTVLQFRDMGQVPEAKPMREGSP